MKVHATIVRSKYMTTVLLTCGHRINVENSVYKKERGKSLKILKEAFPNRSNDYKEKASDIENNMEFNCNICTIPPTNNQSCYQPPKVEISTNVDERSMI